MKFGKRLTIMERTFKDRGEVSYLVFPKKNRFSSPVIPSREVPFILQEFKLVRAQTQKLCEHLQVEDFIISTSNTTSVKWLLGHTSWFFERHILSIYLEEYREFNAHFETLFSLAASQKIFSRPSVEDLLAYRTYVDAAIEDLLFHRLGHQDLYEVQRVIEIGLHYETEIQEKLLSYTKHHFYINPLLPSYEKSEPSFQIEPAPLGPINWVSFSPGLFNIGADDESFAFVNEKPRHIVYLHPFSLANRLVTNKEFLEFIDDGGYNKKELWSEEGWEFLQKNKKLAPAYFINEGGEWLNFTFRGLHPLIENEPVSHVNYFEAAAYAKWIGARLATEMEWEVAAQDQKLGNFFKSHILQPIALKNADLSSAKSSVLQLFGDVWEWTCSPYSHYPGFKEEKEEILSAKNQFNPAHKVLRGGSCLTQESYFRPTFRASLDPSSSIYCTGIRLAKDL
ncbi:MAG: ergothioneine biosynthesis protein EgtB [Chlamydiae bacterium]|nr:ergothioneine biosynthesis protein EgtB [Chlamydiota bacterium]